MDRKRQLIGGAGLLLAGLLCCGFVSGTFFGSCVPATVGGGVILNWPMTEGTGSVLNDTSGNGNTGNTNGAWDTIVGVPCLDLTGGSATAQSNSNVSYLASNIITVDFQAYSDDWTFGMGGGYVISSPYNGAAGIWFITADSMGVLHVVTHDAVGNSAEYVSPNPITNSTWHHFQIVENNSNGTIQIYIDSGLNQAQFAGSSWATAINFTTQQVNVAYNNSGYLAFKGLKISVGDVHTL